MSLLRRLFRFQKGSTRRRKQEEDGVIRNSRSQILYLPVRIPQIYAETSGSKIKWPPQGLVNVSVDGLPWKEVTSFDSSGPNDRVFVLNVEESFIVFGDGVHGSQLPTGVKNISSSYREGMGTAGNMSARQEGSTSSYSSLVYLNITTREISAFEDASLRETAVGGPDTSTRVVHKKHKGK